MSNNFASFCKGLNISLTYSSTENHSSIYAKHAVQTVKNIMNKCQADHWELSLLEYLMTPIRLQGDDRSLLKLLQSHTVCGILPVRKEEDRPQYLQNLEDRRQEQKCYSNKSSQDLNILKEGQNIFYYDQWKSNRLPGIITQRLHERSYQIVTKEGRPITRN